MHVKCVKAKNWKQAWRNSYLPWKIDKRAPGLILAKLTWEKRLTEEKRNLIQVSFSILNS